VGIYHRSSYVGMPEQLLNRPDIITILQQVGRKRMTQSVTCCGLGMSDFESRFSKRSLQNGLMKMMSPLLSRHTVCIVTGCREYPLPSLFFAIYKISSFQNIRSARLSLGASGGRGVGRIRTPKFEFRNLLCGLCVSVMKMTSENRFFLSLVAAPPR